MSAPPLDPDIAGQLAEDLPPEVFANIIATFERDLARLTRELADAAAAGDARAYAMAAHSLAGAAAAVGATALEREARIAMDPAQPEAAATLVPRLQQESGRALAALRALLPA
jgi:HPt (histidine-containing phosphotransfer) domain-containing protein